MVLFSAASQLRIQEKFLSLENFLHNVKARGLDACFENTQPKLLEDCGYKIHHRAKQWGCYYNFDANDNDDY